MLCVYIIDTYTCITECTRTGPRTDHGPHHKSPRERRAARGRTGIVHARNCATTEDIQNTTKGVHRHTDARNGRKWTRARLAIHVQREAIYAVALSILSPAMATLRTLVESGHGLVGGADLQLLVVSTSVRALATIRCNARQSTHASESGPCE